MQPKFKNCSHLETFMLEKKKQLYHLYVCVRTCVYLQMPNNEMVRLTT